jgi:hypothetical protein
MKTLLTISILSVLSVFHLFADDIYLRNGRIIKNCKVIDTADAKVRYETNLGVGTLPLKSISTIISSPFDPLLKTTLEGSFSHVQENENTQEKENIKHINVQGYYYVSIGITRNAYGSNFDGSNIGQEWSDVFGGGQPFYIPKIDPGSGMNICLGGINRIFGIGYELSLSWSNHSSKITINDPSLERTYITNDPEIFDLEVGVKWLFNFSLKKSLSLETLSGGIDFTPFMGFYYESMEMKNVGIDRMVIYSSGSTTHHNWPNHDESISHYSFTFGAYLGYYLTSFLQLYAHGEIPYWEFSDQLISLNVPKIFHADGSHNDFDVLRHSILSFGIKFCIPIKS